MEPTDWVKTKHLVGNLWQSKCAKNFFVKRGLNDGALLILTTSFQKINNKNLDLRKQTH